MGTVAGKGDLFDASRVGSGGQIAAHPRPPARGAVPFVRSRDARARCGDGEARPVEGKAHDGAETEPRVH